MSSFHFVLHPLPGTDEQLAERLRETGEKINRFGQEVPGILSGLRSGPPARCIAVGPAHIAILFEDGRVARIAFSVISDRVDLSRNEQTKQSTKLFLSSQNTARQQSRRGRMRATALRGGRGAGVIMGSSRPVVPAQYVPEDLIAQAQVVLQGKSRNLIVRELQRTNLDVNLAVNNLLSRDDEEGDDGDDSQDSYVSEDLMSLLDSGMGGADSVMLSDAVDAVFPDDMFAYSAIRNRSASRMRSGERPGESSSDRDSFSRWRERQYFGPRRWLENALREPWNNNANDGGAGDSGKGTSKSSGQTQAGTSCGQNPSNSGPQPSSPIWLSDEIEFWPDAGRNIKFTSIVAMHSELVAIGTNGNLYQWKWVDVEPYRHHDNPSVNHPRVIQLSLHNEKIVLVSSSLIRCTVLTESGKLATWVDEAIAHIASRLEHSAQTFHDILQGQKITQLFTSNLYTLAKTDSNSYYWWGVLPFNQRKKLWEKYKTKSKRPHKHSTSHSTNVRESTNEITTGSQVLIRVSPMYQSGAIGFTTSGGIPKVGQLLNSAWSLSDKCRFKVLPGPRRMESKRSESRSADSMPPPPSPASSTCSDTTLPATTQKRPKKHVTAKDNQEKNEEEWFLKDVIFVEDSKNIPIGHVLKIDGSYALVNFKGNQTAGAAPIKEEDVASLLADSRLLRIDDLQHIKNGCLPKAPDCIQKVPKKVPLNDTSNILSVSVDSNGIHAIIREGKKIVHKSFSLNSGKVEGESAFQTELSAFLGTDQNLISLQCSGDNELISILRDGNGTLYPLVKDCLDAIKDPILLDLPPIRSVGLGIHALPHVGEHQKNQVGVIVLAMEQQTLMPKILKCDVDGLRQFLSNMDSDSQNKSSTSTINRIISERCDGNRNILHACVSMATPTINKDTDSITVSAGPGQFSSGTAASVEVAVEALASGLGTSSSATGTPRVPQASSPSNVLRDMMRRANSSVHEPDESYVPIQVSAAASVPNLDADDSNESIDSAHALSVGFRSYSVNSPGTSSSAQPGSGLGQSAVVWDPAERTKNAHAALKHIFESTGLEAHLYHLLCEKDSRGQTPFMLAVSSRAYQSALTIFEVVLKISKERSSDSETQKKIVLSMIYPPGSLPDDSPLHVLCCNDTCSFTWTGAEHINQDIFECRTCGLVGSLCCCTECARVCHKGHDCKLKRTSPTAYCDCWEKCKCKALVMGNQQFRYELLAKIISETDLVSVNNSRGENILLFLVQTSARQLNEQKQFRSRRGQRKPDMDVEIPEHDLQPPRFCRIALEQLLDDWSAVKAMIMSGVNDTVAEQTGTALLDKFTYKVLVKCGTEMIDALLATLIRELQSKSPSRRSEASMVARRFIRSVARIFVIASVEMAPLVKKGSGPSRNPPTYIEYCRRVFQALIMLSIEELCEIANSQIAPVRLGVVRPTSSFPLLAATTEGGSEELFSVDPLQPYSSSHTSDPARFPGSSRGSRRTQFDQEASSAQGQGSGFQAHDDGDGDHDADDVMDDADNEADRHVESEHEMEQNEQGIQNIAQNIVAAQEAADNAEQESDMELDMLAESESDSDDNQNEGSSSQRGIQAHPASGSDNGAGVGNLALFSDDSEDSTQQEDEEEDEEESDGNDSDDREVPLPTTASSANTATGSVVTAVANTANPAANQPSVNPQSASSAVPVVDEFSIASEDQLFERRGAISGPSGTGQPRGSLAPVSMQWAIRSRDVSGVRSSGLVFIDHTSGTLRRSNATTAVAAAAAAAAANNQDTVTMATTASGLARAFGIIMREITDLFRYLQDYHNVAPILSRKLEITQEELNKLQAHLDKKLLGTWEWLLTVMDSTESQLRFGGSLAGVGDPLTSHSRHHQRVHGSSVWSTRTLPTIEPARATRDEINAARREFLSYSLSLMRAHNAEHLDSLPVIDVSSLKHIAYVFDSLIYFLKSGVEECATPTGSTDTTVDLESLIVHDPDEPDDMSLTSGQNPSAASPMDVGDFDEEVSQLSAAAVKGVGGGKHTFFQRSESTLCLGCPAPDPFQGPVAESLPLAEKPHLLQPTVRKEDLFGLPMCTGGACGLNEISSSNLGLTSRSEDKSGYSCLLERKPQSGTDDMSKMDIEPSDSDNRKKDETPTPNTTTLPCKPPPLVKITPPATKQWEQNVPQDLSMNTPRSGDENEGSVVKRAPIIVSPKKLTASSPSSQGAGSSTTEGRSPGKSVIVCHRPSSIAPNESDAPEILVVPADAAVDNVSSNVTVETTPRGSTAQKLPALTPKKLNIKPSDTQLALLYNPSVITDEVLLGRWRVTLELFGRVFVDDVGLEPGSIIAELGGFPVKETRFRREMERLRNLQQRDLILSKLERDRNLLIMHTFKELNNHFSTANRRASSPNLPLAVNRVKVTFKDEPGEGSGVARSFYTAIAEAIVSDEKLPNLEGCLGAAKYGTGSNNYNVLQRLRLREDFMRRGPQVRILKRGSTRVREVRRNLSFDARPFHPSTSTGEGSSNPPNLNDHLSSHQQQIGDRLYAKVLKQVHQLRPSLAPKITGMLLELPPPQLLILLASEENLKTRVDEAVDIILVHSRDIPGDGLIDLDVFNFSKNSDVKKTDEWQEADDLPLFYQPGKRGFFSPLLGKGSHERLNAFRNVGRILGLCLLQNELCPVYLNRHVLKFILGRPIRFHDLAFFDPLMYESFRQLIVSSEEDDSGDLFSTMELTFSMDLSPEEGGRNVELIPNGRNVEVNKSNVYDYVRKYADYRMIRSQYKALEELKNGVYDVIPVTAVEGLTSEDFRLLLNGVGDINVATLISYTSFNDESAESNDKLVRFKKWFWSILEKMSNLERQELVYFWTGSPALPASEDGFQPMPSITIRPADDAHLPTANTCISRLYVPLYSSRHILRHKLLMAIKAKNFGFV